MNRLTVLATAGFFLLLLGAAAGGCVGAGSTSCAVDGDCLDGRSCVEGVCGGPGGNAGVPDGGSSGRPGGPDSSGGASTACEGGARCDAGAEAGPQSSWKEVASMAVDRSAFAAVTGADGLIYAIGGYTKTRISSTEQVEAYPPGTDKWFAAPPMSAARWHFAAASSQNGKLYAFGLPSGPDSESFAVATSATAWTPIKELPARRGDIAATTGPDGRIYVIGGSVDSFGAAMARVDVYTPGTNTWAAAASLQTPRAGLAAVTGRDGRIYAIGGWTTARGTPLTTVEAYDPGADTWTTVASMTIPRHFHAAAVVEDGRIFVLGGVARDTNKDRSYHGESSVEIYTPSRNAWEPGPPMTTFRSKLAATIVNGTIFAIGGERPNWSDTNQENLRTVETLRP